MQRSCVDDFGKECGEVRISRLLDRWSLNFLPPPSRSRTRTGQQPPSGNIRAMNAAKRDDTIESADLDGPDALSLAESAIDSPLTTAELCRVVGSRVRELRQALNMTMSAFANDAGISLGMLSKIEPRPERPQPVDARAPGRNGEGARDRPVPGPRRGARPGHRASRRRPRDPPRPRRTRPAVPGPRHPARTESGHRADDHHHHRAGRRLPALPAPRRGVPPRARGDRSTTAMAASPTCSIRATPCRSTARWPTARSSSSSCR